MSLPSRLRWLLPGYNLAPVLTRNGYEISKAPADIVALLAGPLGKELAGPTLVTGTSQSATVGSAFHASRLLCTSSSASKAGSGNSPAAAESSASAVAYLQQQGDAAAAARASPESQPPERRARISTSAFLRADNGGLHQPSESFPEATCSAGGQEAVRSDGRDADGAGGSIKGAGSGGDREEDGRMGVAWHRSVPSVVQARRAGHRHQPPPQDGEPSELSAKMRWLRESLRQVGQDAAGRSVAGLEGRSGGDVMLLPADGGASDGGGGRLGGYTRSGSGGGGGGGSGDAGRSVRHVEGPRGLPYRQRLPAAATVDGALPLSGRWGVGQPPGSNVVAATEGEGVAEWQTSGAAAAAATAHAVARRSGASTAEAAAERGRDDTAEALSYDGPSSTGVNARGIDGQQSGGGGGGVVGRLAAADRDAELSRRIAELQNLRDAELLLYDTGSWFRSRHSADLLARLPALDLDGSNSGPRTRRLIRFLSATALRDLQPLSGPSLARCIAALARLGYAPPETVAPLCAALLAPTQPQPQTHSQAHCRPHSHAGRAAAGSKLRACGGGELADLAWALAFLEQLYGDMHQAIKQPARAALEAASSRVVGHIRSAAVEVQGVAERARLELEPAGEGLAAAEAEPPPSQLAVAVAEGQEGDVREKGEERSVGVGGGGGWGGDSGGGGGGGNSAAAARGTTGGTTGSSSTPDADADVAGNRNDLTAGAGDDAEERLAPAAATPAVSCRVRGGGGSGSDAVSPGGDLQPPTTGRREAPALVWMVPKAMDRIWEKLAAAAGSCADQGGMTGEQLAKVAWAYAQVGRADHRLYDKLAAATLVLLEPFLEKTAQAAAAAAPGRGGGARRRAAAAAAVAASRSGAAPLDPASVSTLAASFVAVGRRDPPLLAALAAVAATYKDGYDNDQVASLAVSYARAAHYDEALCTALATVSSRRRRHLSSSQLVALVGSLAALRHRDDQLAGTALARSVWDKRDELSGEQVCELMWACAHLDLNRKYGTDSPGVAVLGLGLGMGLAATAGGGARGGAAAVVLATALRGRCEGRVAADLARALWALSLLPLQDHPDLQARLADELREQLVRHPIESFSRESLLQLYGAAQLLGPVLPAMPAASAAVSAAQQGAEEYLYDMVYGSEVEDGEGNSEEEGGEDEQERNLERNRGRGRGKLSGALEPPPPPEPPLSAARSDPRDSHQSGGAGKRPKHASGSTSAAADASLPLPSYDVREMYDEASGRKLWEVVPKARDGADGGNGDAAARVLPLGLLRACRAAAAEWAAAEQRRLEALEEAEAEGGEMWRLDVAAALRHLTASEPLPRWATRDHTAVADLLLIPQQQQTTATRANAEASFSSPSGGGPPPAPLAVLLLGPSEVTRNPPHTPLGSVQMRQRLLEAAGARVVVVPRILWRVVGDDPDEQICLLANLINDQR
ncbi:hypothetical protein PLESTB_000951600 [Pleodorina starrii]|uniref:RNA-editing substrate-binding complex 6 protein domain-containing protein n=1 Tax=Pleodorina starrii TaxID=330485 RepID=A0A9W6BN27_9CHLO|nr:hypothetical protein PLESTM_001147100 [Pleodorina starrii]GLC55172.1 hypothetical protein PLESTB_000951600 [Pleodorina starrii]GLC71075.1 hypothetical protein PLESTF_001071900 [Pleodorina starrii]